MDKIRDRYWLKVLLATGLVVASLAFSESSLYGLSLAVVGCFVMVGVVACALFVLAKMVPMVKRSGSSRSVLAFLGFFALTYWIIFSSYLDGGTFFVGDRPYILKGTIQIAGYFFVISYATVLTIAVRLIERPIVPSD